VTIIIITTMDCLEAVAEVAYPDEAHHFCSSLLEEESRSPQTMLKEEK
jgi:hypothetical protein